MGDMTTWIIGLCVAVVVAVAGWTVSVTQAMKAKAYERVISDALTLTTRVTAHDVEIAVLKTEFCGIREALDEIKTMLQAHMGVK